MYLIFILSYLLSLFLISFPIVKVKLEFFFLVQTTLTDGAPTKWLEKHQFSLPVTEITSDGCLGELFIFLRWKAFAVGCFFFFCFVLVFPGKKKMTTCLLDTFNFLSASIRSLPFESNWERRHLKNRENWPQWRQFAPVAYGNWRNGFHTWTVLLFPPFLPPQMHLQISLRSLCVHTAQLWGWLEPTRSLGFPDRDNRVSAGYRAATAAAAATARWPNAKIDVRKDQHIFQTLNRLFGFDFWSTISHP